MVLYTGFNGKVNKKLMVNYTTITCLSFHDNYTYPLRKMSNPDPCPEERGVSLAFVLLFIVCQRPFALRAPRLRFLGLSLGWHIVLTDTKKQQAELTAYRIDDFLLYSRVGIRLARLVSPTSALV